MTASPTRAPGNVALDAERELYLTEDGQVWIPDAETDIQQQICVIGHAGASSHRDVAASRKPRPFGPTLQATKLNKDLHFDFLSLPASGSGMH
ncbi:hypothetical protein GN244_ATG11837 [Phytophthora infestans]|uniref:Uncharacterized protein n=1 Tax=Phytophthora infestans TaxID=4787 RepID=A0A833SP71_PHYIN|nr:hypothetical protein GN244_ATG11837 [Phytophthora infestans]